MTHVDGNALAGAFATALGIEITVTVGRCRGCGSSFNLACAHVFITAMGAVMRCGHCQAVLGVIVRGFRETLVNLSGLDYIRVPHL